MRLKSHINRATRANARPSTFDEQEATIPIDPVSAALVESGELTDAELQRIADYQARTGMTLADAAVDLGLVPPEAIARTLALHAEEGLIKPGDDRVSPAVVTAFDPADPLSLKLRALRARLFAPADMRENAIRILVLAGVGSSDTPGVAANLAVSVAQLGFRTLLVDANFAAPSHHSLFGLADAEGVTTMLAGGGGGAREAAVQPTAVPNLDVMTAGPAMSAVSEMVERVSLPSLLRGLRHGHRAAIIDAGDQAPEIVAALGRGADGALIVAERERSSMAPIRAVMERVRAAEVEVLGTVLSH